MTDPVDDVVFFDGVCNLCAGFVQFIIRNDRKKVFRFAPIQSEIGKLTFQTHRLDPEISGTILVISHGKPFTKSDASIEVMRRMGGIWSLGFLLKVFPRALRDRVYETIARNRYRWFGRKESCMIPTKEIRSRFLE